MPRASKLVGNSKKKLTNNKQQAAKRDHLAALAAAREAELAASAEDRPESNLTAPTQRKGKGTRKVLGTAGATGFDSLLAAEEADDSALIEAIHRFFAPYRSAIELLYL